MEKQVIFRDNQEQQAADHNDIQSFSRQSFDHLVQDAVTKTRRYAGFNTVKTAQTEIQVAPGRFYEQDGGVYAKAATTTLSMVSYLPAAAQRIVTLSAYGVENDTDVEERDFLINAETGATEPDAVAMTRSRDAVLVITQGAESADPQPPALPATHVAIAQILLDATQVVTVSMIATNAVTSTEALDQRARLLEDFKNKIEPRVSALASDLAALANQTKTSGKRTDLARLQQDLARVKERLEIPDTASDYGADRFLLPAKSDTTNALGLGFDAKVEEGIRFADANADEFEMSLFSANDPNASLTSGLLLPKFTHELKLTTGEFHSDLGIAQFGFQTHELTQGTLTRTRLRYGGSRSWCINGEWWGVSAGEQPVAGLMDFETWQEVQTSYVAEPRTGHLSIRYDYYWHDSWSEPYWYLLTVDHTITGAQVAQTFLVSNDIWATRLGFYVTQKAANENIFVTLCEVTDGKPNPKRVICHQVYNHADIVVGWNRMTIVPTLLRSGQRYAIMVTSNANHKFGMASGQSYLDGSFFTTTDGAYFQGDLTKDLMLEVWGAKFASPQVAIEMGAINLDGGMRDIDILAQSFAPEATQLVYEVRPGGSGEWIPLTPEHLDALNGAPVLMQFRIRFIGTRDIMPAVMLTGSRVKVARPKTAFKHVSKTQTLAAPSDDISVKLLLERFDDTPHDLTCKLRVGGTTETADVTETRLVTEDGERYERIFNFQLPAPTSTFAIIVEGSTTSVADTFHVAERVHWAQ